MPKPQTIFTNVVDYARCTCGSFFVPGSYTTQASRTDNLGNRYRQVKCRDCGTTGQLHERPKGVAAKTAIRRQRAVRSHQSN